MRSSKTLYSVHDLRFFAAFSVAVHHSIMVKGQPIGSVFVGAAGVDVFFVISGLVIGLSDFRDGAGEFLRKRIIRVLPLYWIATAVFVLLRLHQGEVFPSADHLFRSLFLLPRYGEHWSPIYFPAWTLVFEMFFYLSYAATLCLVGKHVNLVIAALMIFVATLHIPVPFVPGAFFRSDLCFEFAVGVLIAHAFAHGLHTPRPLGALLIALSLIGFAANASGVGDRIVGWGLPAALLVLGVMGFESWPGLKSKWLVLGGNASYAMYLFQLPAMALVRDCANRFGLPVDGWSWIPRELTLLGSVILVAVAVHLWVEKPLMRWLRRMADRHLRSPFADSAALGK